MVNFFIVFFVICIFCFVVAICDLVHDVETMPCVISEKMLLAV